MPTPKEFLKSMKEKKVNFYRYDKYDHDTAFDKIMNSIDYLNAQDYVNNTDIEDVKRRISNPSSLKAYEIDALNKKIDKYNAAYKKVRQSGVR